MAYYQCFKTKSRDVYCSSYKVKNHTEGAAWVTQAMAHYNIKASDLLGKPYEADSIPRGAITYPAAAKKAATTAKKPPAKKPGAKKPAAKKPTTKKKAAKKRGGSYK